MNRNQNTANPIFNGFEKQKNFFRFLKNIFAVKGVLSVDVFQYSNQYNEKLPIIYANIRV
jgi:hypothetical protein